MKLNGTVLPGSNIGSITIKIDFPTFQASESM